MAQPSLLFGFPERLERWQRLLPYVLLLSITFALYGTTLFFGFVWDDFLYISRDFRIHSLSWRYFSSVWSNTFLGHYAPVHNAFLALLYHFFGEKPFGYHLAQLLLHAGCVCLLYLLLNKLETSRVALLATLLFVVHPTDIETVAWVSETKSTLAFLFFLLSFWFYIRLRERERWTDIFWVALFLILSVLSKINTVVAPAIFLLYDYKEGFPPRKSRWEGLGALFLISATMTLVHIGAFHHSAQGLEKSYNGGLAMHLQNLPFLLWFYVHKALFPRTLSAVELFRVYSKWTWVVGAAWIILLLALWMLYRSNRRTQFWALWFVISLAPVLQIVPNTIWVADRYLYVPLAGAAVLVSSLLFWLTDRFAAWPWKLGWELAMSAVLVALALETSHHLPIWRSELSLWEGTISTCQSSAYCHAALGEALLQNGEPQRGGDELVQAARMEPSPINLMYLGDALTLSARNYPAAVRTYGLALKAAEDPRERADPSLEVALFAKLARAFIRAGMLSEASAAIQAGGNVMASDLNLRVVDSFLQWKLGNLPGARRSLQSSIMDSGETSSAADFINFYWGDTAQVDELLADLRSPRAQNPQSPQTASQR